MSASACTSTGAGDDEGGGGDDELVLENEHEVASARTALGRHRALMRNMVRLQYWGGQLGDPAHARSHAWRAALAIRAQYR